MDKLKKENISFWLVIALCVIAASIATVMILNKGATAYTWIGIAFYWVILTLKNLNDARR